MKPFSLPKSAVAVEVLLISCAAALRHYTGMKVGPIDGRFRVADASNFNGWGTFDQLLDHSNPNLGTFRQRFWYGTQYWKGPGSPIYLMNPGEQAADGFNTTYTTEQRLTGRFAKETGGAVVIIEHRYWGESSPYDDLTVKNLQYHTLENAIHDLTYFANNWVPPFDRNGTSTPKKSPWSVGRAWYVPNFRKMADK